MMGFGMGLMGFGMLLPLLLVLGFAWLAARASTGRYRLDSEAELEAILRRRLAAGQINSEQYAQARTVLGLTEGS